MHRSMTILQCWRFIENYDGSSPKEVVGLAEKIDQVGASIIHFGVGWLEARVNIIASSVLILANIYYG